VIGDREKTYHLPPTTYHLRPTFTGEETMALQTKARRVRIEREENPNALGELGEKIFLDRYALKDVTKRTLGVGDTVVVCVDMKTGQREIGTVRAISGMTVTVELRDGTVMEQAIEHIDKPIELRPEEMMDRVAKGIAEVESEEKRPEWERNFRWLLDGWKFVPGGRILTAAGSDQRLTLYNCYVISSPEDSRRGIIETLSQMTEIMSRGGGVGINISSLRPKHSYVRGVNGRSSGAVSWGALFSFVTGKVEQGGCFVAGQRLMTNKGLIPVEELADRIEYGEEFLASTHRGPRRIIHTFRNRIQPALRITTVRGYTLEVTPDHKLMTVVNGEFVLRPASQLKEGDHVTLLTDMKGNFPKEEVPLNRDNCRAGRHTCRLPKTLTPEIAFFLGVYTADGSLHYSDAGRPETLRIVCNADRSADINRILSAIRQVFGIKGTVHSGSGDCRTVCVTSVRVIDFLLNNNLLKKSSRNAGVPEQIFRSPRSVVEAFIAGYFSGDGTAAGRINFLMRTASKRLHGDLKLLLLWLGIPTRSQVLREKKEYGLSYAWSVSGQEFADRFHHLLIGYTTKARDYIGPTENRVFPWPFNSYHRFKYVKGIRSRTTDNHIHTSRTTVRFLAENIDRITSEDQDHVQLMDACVCDQIAQIELCGEVPTYDFEVEDVHLLSGNGFYTSNSRRGALMLILNVWHPDVLEFIQSKREMGQITNANISVGITDDFMEAVEKDQTWDLIFPDTSDPDYDGLWDGDIVRWRSLGKPIIVHKTVRAREIWNSIIESAWASAEPGVWFSERANKMSNSHYFASLCCTNPCGEQPLPAWSVCNLGAINLSKFVSNGDVDWPTLATATRYAVRFLDNVVDATPYFFEENRRQQLSERRVGLGTMGLAEMLIRLGLRYGSDESLSFIDRLYKFIAVEAYRASCDFAAEKGSFPQFDAEKFLQSGFMQGMPEEIRDLVSRQGIRNVTLLTQAPTGTTGTLVGTSTGIEPFYSWTYYRKSRLGMHEEHVSVVDEWKGEHPGEPLPSYFVTAMDLTPEEHVRVEAAIQRWTDSSISKTANLPQDYTVEQTRDLYELMYRLGCKGGTVYRDSSRDEQVLYLKKEHEEATPLRPAVEEPKVRPLPYKRRGVTVSRPTPIGTAHITMNDDDEGRPFEVFVEIGKAGSDIKAMAEAMGRLMSLILRLASPVSPLERVQKIVNQIKGIGGARSIGFGKERVRSLPDAVALALEEHYKVRDEGNSFTPQGTHDAGNGKVAADLCPNCGLATYVHEEGCMVCHSCGYSEC
jgi:ribonucleoside-diphosphate reductase alpha chain